MGSIPAGPIHQAAQCTNTIPRVKAGPAELDLHFVFAVYLKRFMTHRVNAAVFRIGKSLNWHSLGLPLYRFRDLRVNLFLNYFLSRFLIREHYRMVRYGVRSEARFLKISIIAFRLMDTRIGASGTFLGIGGDVFFETY